MTDEQQKTDATSYEEAQAAEEGIGGELEKVRGVVRSQKTNIRITENDPDWLAGKEKGDKKAADRFAEKFWSEKHTDELGKQIDDPENTLFISVPSSSKNNVHPVSLAEKLSGEFGGKFVTGETYFNVMHERQSKKIRPFERVFHPRIYEPLNSAELKTVVGNREVIITDDIFTTGGSAAALIRTLDSDGNIRESRYRIFRQCETVRAAADSQFHAQGFEKCRHPGQSKGGCKKSDIRGGKNRH